MSSESEARLFYDHHNVSCRHFVFPSAAQSVAAHFCNRFLPALPSPVMRFFSLSVARQRVP